MKIVYCTDTICHPGGIQRVTIAKANALADIDGNEVWIVVTDNKRPTPVLPISEKVHLIDLDVNYYEDDWKSKLHVLKGIFVKRREHSRKLKALFDAIQPNVVISTGTSEKKILPRLKIATQPAFIREIHFTTNYRQLAANGWFDKCSAWIGDFLDYRIFIKRYDKIVVLTNEDKELHWKHNDKVIVIPNPLTVKHSKRSTLTNQTVITAGRLVAQKNFSSLVRAWAIVNQFHPDWRLEIWGEGNLKAELQRQIDSSGLADCVYLLGYTNDIISKFSAVSIYVSSSLFEGFPLVLVEAVSCGLPIVSYAYPCGPRDIISDNKDGFIVPVNDERAMAERIIYLIENEDVRRQMGAAAMEKSKQYYMDIIIQKWSSLFYELVHEKFGNFEKGSIIEFC